MLKYIDGVLSLEQFEPMNTLYRMVFETKDDISKAIEYGESALKYKTRAYIEVSFGDAYQYMCSAIMTAKFVSDGSIDCEQYIEALEAISDYYSIESMRFAYYSSYLSAYSAGVDTVIEIQDMITNAQKSVSGIVDSLPTIY